MDESLSVCCGNGDVDRGEDCDDGDADHCNGCTPSCTPTPDCAGDDNPCTGPTCEPGIGCEQLDGAACEPDGNPCTDDVCLWGSCTHYSPCDGGSDSACRRGECTPAGCVFENLPDGTACELNSLGASFPSVCLAGACDNPCDDDDPCTSDNPIGSGVCLHIDWECAADCTAQPDGTRCSDGDPCSIGACQGHSCVSSPKVCDDPCRGAVCAGIAGCGGYQTCEDDGNPCTVGTCDAAFGGCHAVPLTGASCPDDGDACTADVCDAGLCTHIRTGCGGTTTTASSTTTSSTTTTTATTTSTTTTTILHAGATLIPTTKLVLTDRQTSPADPSRRRIVFTSSTRRAADANRIRVSPRSGAGDPTAEGLTGGGATLTVYNAAGSGESVVVALPSSGWSADHRTPIPRRYRYSGPAGAAIFRIVLKGDVLRMKGGGLAWGYTLDETSQDRIAVRLTLGDGTTWCAEAGPKTDRVDRFVAQPRSAAPVACPPVP